MTLSHEHLFFHSALLSESEDFIVNSSWPIHLPKLVGAMSTMWGTHSIQCKLTASKSPWVYSFGWLEICKSNPHLLICSMEISNLSEICQDWKFLTNVFYACVLQKFSVSTNLAEIRRYPADLHCLLTK